jgi:hypothetical protein
LTVLIDDVVAQLGDAQAHGFDVSEERRYEVANRAIRWVARRAQSIQAEVAIGTTVADQEEYTLPANVVDLRRIRVGEVADWTRQSLETLWDLKDVDSGVTLSGRGGGIFAPRYADDGATQSISIYPAPDEAGLAIVGYAAIEPAADLEEGDTVPFADEEPVLNRATGILYREVDENPEMAAYYTDLAETGAEELRRKTISRVGSGPHRIPLRMR